MEHFIDGKFFEVNNLIRTGNQSHVSICINNIKTIGSTDTGAMASVMSKELAEQLGYFEYTETDNTFLSASGSIECASMIEELEMYVEPERFPIEIDIFVIEGLKSPFL